MHAYTEILKPSVISQCLLLPTDNVENPLLVIVRGNSLLQVFSDINSSDGPRWLAEFPLQGVITHVGSFETNKLFVTFLQAKMVVLEWHPEELTFKTKSLHLYEKVSEKSLFDTPGSRVHALSSDQQNGCLTFWFQREFAAFVRFQRISDPFSAYRAQSNEETNGSPKSSIINIADLAKSLRVSEITEIVHLTSYREPTVAILAWNKPSWAGLVKLKELSTKSLFVGSLKVVPGASPIFTPVISISDVTYEAQKIFAVSKSQTCIALVVCSNHVLVLTAAGILHEVEPDSTVLNERFENSALCQIPGSNNVLMLLQSGVTIFLDATKLTMSTHDCPNLVGGNNCVISALGNTVVIANQHSPAKILQVSVTVQHERRTAISFDTLRDLYNKLFDVPSTRTRSFKCEFINQIESYGSLSSITSIDNGLACATTNGVLIVERELSLEEVSSGQLDTDVVPGQFYIVTSVAAENPILIKSYQDSMEASNEDATSTKKRKKLHDSHKSRTVLSELYQSDSERSKKRASTILRGLAGNQFTFVIKVVENLVFAVQSNSISVHQAGNWKLLKSKSIPAVKFAESQGDKVLVHHAENDKITLFSGDKLDILFSESHVDQASVSQNMLAYSINKTLTIKKLDGALSSFDLGDLAQVCRPIGSNVAATDGEATHTETNKGEFDRAEEKISAIFAMHFNSIAYIGVHFGRVFSIYEIVGSFLIKRYTVPFAVNQSPIYVSELDVIVIPGAKSHIVVKGRQAGFNCHRLQLYGEKLLDAFAVRKLDDSAQYELAWLGDKETIHFAQFDQTIDMLSYSMPTRHIKLETTKPSIIHAIAYHDDFAALVVGANEICGYQQEISKKADEACSKDPSDQELIKQGKNKEDRYVRPELESDSEGPEKLDASVFVGNIYILPLTTYRFQALPVAELGETLLDLKLVDYGEPGRTQILAIGTANTAAEREETNGHIYLYKLSEEIHENLNSGESADQGDPDPPPILLKAYSDLLVRGAVSSICEIMGNLAVAHGQQVHLYNYIKGLEPVGFFDAQVYMQDIKALRNILILGERLCGPRLVNFAIQPYRLDLLASSDVLGIGQSNTTGNENSTKPITTAVEGISSAMRGDLSVVHCGYDGRLQIFQYDPDNPESVGGPRLVPLATLFTGRICNSMIASQTHLSNDISAYGATSDGTVFSVKSLSEETFRTLFVLTQQMMDKEIPHAGLNPRMHRSMLSSMQNYSNQIIDINFSQNFWNLPLSRQAEFARRLGYAGLARVRKALNKEGRNSLQL